MNSFHTLLLYCQFISAFFTFFILYFIDAPYGRHVKSGWGPLIGAKTGWILMELPAVIIMLFFFIAAAKTSIHIIFLAIWQLHYLQRTFVFPFLMRGKDKKMPILIAFFSIMFNSMNGFINGYFIFFLAGHTISWVYDIRFIAGFLIFICGFFINLQSDHILRNLRKPGETGYKIPHGGLFRFVSAPNYLGEIMEWIGWAVLTWSLPGLAFALFTIANLMPRAYRHHTWYKAQFPGYPAERKALIPFIY